MSAFYDRQKAASSLSFLDDRAPSRSQSRLGESSISNASSTSLNNGRGGAPMHAMMVPGMVVPSTDRPDPNSPHSEWEAYIVKQAQDFENKRNKASASPPAQTSNSPRIVWADQVRRPATSQSQPFVYTKARDRVASPTPSTPTEASSRSMLRKPSFDVGRRKGSMDVFRSMPAEEGRRRGSFDMLRRSPDSGRNTPSPPSSIRPLISSPIITQSILTTMPASPTPAPAAKLASYESLFNRSMSQPPNVPQSVESHTSTVRSLSPLPLSLPTDNFSESLLIDLGRRRSSATSSSSGRAPGPSDLIEASQQALYSPQMPSPPSVADTYSVHSRRSSWASSIDLDPAVICTPPLSNEGFQFRDQPSPALPAFLAEYGLDEDSEESETECSTKPDNSQVLSPLPKEAVLDESLPAQPVFQRLEADIDTTSRFGANLPRLEIASLPREKDEVRSARARLLSPGTFKKAFTIKRKGSNSSDSAPSHGNSSSEHLAESQPPASLSPPQLPSLVTQEIPSWSPASAPQGAGNLRTSPSIESHSQSADSADSSLLMPLSPMSSVTSPSITSSASQDSTKRRHRVATPGLTKKSSSKTDGAAPVMDPHLTRGQTRSRSNGSVSSHTPSVASSGKGRRGYARSSGRSRITDSMPSFADMAGSLAVPTASHQRRNSNRSLSSDGSVDAHSNASNSSSYAKVGGSSDESAPLSPSLASPVKGVLRKRSPSEDFPLLSPRKEVSFNLPASAGISTVVEEQHEQKQRSHLKLPPMKLQLSSTRDVEQTPRELTQDDLDILTFLSSFGSDVQSVESLELLDNIHAAAGVWPKREEWDSLPAYLLAYATTFLSTYSDDSATQVYSSSRAPACTTIATAPFPSSSVYTSTLRSVVRVASWEQPLLTLGVSSMYGYSWAQRKLAGVLLAGLAILVATQGAQSESASELNEIYAKIAPVVLGSEARKERMRNLLLWRSPKASLRFTGLLVAAAVGATQIEGWLMQLPGLLLGLALFVWLPAMMKQPEWAPVWLTQQNPIDALLYDVPTDAQHAILTLRRRAAAGEQLVHRPTAASLPTLNPTSFDHRVSAHELKHAADVFDGAHFAKFDGEKGHLIVLASRVYFRTLAGKEEVSLEEELKSTAMGAKITLDARLEKIVRLEKKGEEGLEMRLKNGQVFVLENVRERDGAFNRILALAPQKWH